MTELEFINANPSNYGEGANVNLLYSSSVADPGVDNTPTAPFVIQGISIPFIAENGVDVSNALKEVKTLRFDFTNGVTELNITARQKKNGWYFLRTSPVTFNTLPTLVSIIGPGTAYEQNIYRYDNSNFIFLPYTQLSFINNDYNVLFNNASISKPNAVAQVVDRSTDAANPTNLLAILNQTATPAEIQNCSYTKVGIVNARYDGTKLNSGSIPGNDPALGLKEFKGSKHPIDASNDKISNINLADRDTISVYFNPLVSGSHPTKAVQTFPSGSNYLYEEQDNRFIRIVNSKVFSTEKGEIYSTDEFGVVNSVV